MFRRSAILPAALVAVALALPACGKKKDTPPAGPPPDYTGSKMGPPGGRLPGPGGPMPGDPNAGQPADPSRPQPPNLSNPLARQQSQNNLKQIGLAFHNAADTYGGRFPAGIADKSGKVGLSWRVALLPFVEQVALYKQFKLDEPWDSENNKKLIAQMPKIYAPPGTETSGYTYYRSFSGPGTVMPAPAPGRPGDTVFGTKLTSITDGTSNTLLVVEATDPVIWTKPDELAYEAGKPLPKVGGSVFKEGVNVVLCSGETRWVAGQLAPDKLKALITTSGGELITDW